jgi:protein-S-isoprenylcysteine O-methyltransferase Ste14
LPFGVETYTEEDTMKIALQTIASMLVGLVFFGVALFLPAGTFHYWQGWVFIAVFTIATNGPSFYLAVTDPAALQRRMHAGPMAETRTVQKIVIVGTILSVIATVVISAFDHRFGWSAVPTSVVVVGNVLVAVGLGLAQLVVIQNRYAAATITVEDGQPLVSSGLYRLVRHPLYVGALIMMVGTPLALGSYWGLVAIIPGLLALAVRIEDEERMLLDDLDGYEQYMKDVRYRLVPYVW